MGINHIIISGYDNIVIFKIFICKIKYENKDITIVLIKGLIYSNIFFDAIIVKSLSLIIINIIKYKVS